MKRFRDSYYLVTEDGEVWSEKTKRFLKKHPVNGGYLSVMLRLNGGSKRITLHRLVAEVFLKKVDNKPQVNHINGIKTDNRAINLEWVSAKENIAHSVANGLHFTRIVLDTSNGVYYDSVKNAANAAGIARTTLSNQLNGHKRNKTPFIYA